MDVLYILKNKKNYFFCLPAILTFLILFLLVNNLDRDYSRLSFNFTSESRGTTQVFINNFHSPKLFNVKENTEQVIEVGDLTSDINLIRIDPPKALGSKVEISNIIFENSERIFKIISIDEILNWGIKDLKIVKSTNKKVVFTVVGNDPYIVTGSRVILDTENKFINIFLKVNDDYKLVSFITVLIIFLALLMVYFYLNFNYKIIFPLIFISLFSFIIFLYIPNYQFGFSSVSSTIGRGVYLGLANFPNQLSILLIFIFCIMMAFLTANKMNLIGSNSDLKAKIKVNKNNNFLYPLSLFLISFFLLTPDLITISKQAISNDIVKDWDGSNINTWKYMINKGLIPYKDFWFPYGGRAVFYLNTPYGDLFIWIYKTFVYGSLGSTLYYLFKGNILKYILITSLLIYGEINMIFWGSSRYLLAFTIIFSFLCINYSDKILNFRRLLFWMNVIFAIFFEANVLVYCAPAVIFKLLYDYFEHRNINLSLKNFLINFFPLLIIFILYILFLNNYGILNNWLSYYLNIGDQAIYGSEPTNLIDGPLKILILSSPFIAIVISLYSLLIDPSQNKTIGICAASIGIIASMLLMKHLVRSMDWQLFIVPTLIVILLFLNNSNYRNKLNLIVLGIVIGLVLFISNHHNFFKYLLQKTLNSPTLIIHNYQFLFGHKFNTLIKEIKSESFKKERYSVYKKENILVNFLEKEMNKNAKIYVLSDNSILYVLLNQHPPYHINLYNASPIYEQNKNITWLEQNKPQFIIWDKKLYFDLVPNIIRSPVIYQYIVENYELFKNVAGFDILKKRFTNKGETKIYWNSIFKNIDLGFIPGASKIGNYNECAENLEGCRPVIHLKMSQVLEQKKITLDLTINNNNVKISLLIKPTKKDYYILLDRLLFWWLSEKKPVNIKVESVSKNMVIKSKYYKIPEKVLY